MGKHVSSLSLTGVIRDFVQHLGDVQTPYSVDRHPTDRWPDVIPNRLLNRDRAAQLTLVHIVPEPVIEHEIDAHLLARLGSLALLLHVVTGSDLASTLPRQPPGAIGVKLTVQTQRQPALSAAVAVTVQIRDPAARQLPGKKTGDFDVGKQLADLQRSDTARCNLLSHFRVSL
jgi:hypothetical protein